MSGWFSLIVHLGSEDGGDVSRRGLERKLDRLGDAVVNRTPLLRSAEGVGSLVALRKESWSAALELANKLDGQARAFRMAAEVVATGEGRGSPEEAFVSLAVNLEEASLHFDDPAVSGAMRATLGGYLPMLGRRLIATSSLMVENFDYAGGLTAFWADSPEEAHVFAAHDAWGRIYPGFLFGVLPGFFARTPPPAGPVIQRYRNLPWPGGLRNAKQVARRAANRRLSL